MTCYFRFLDNSFNIGQSGALAIDISGCLIDMKTKKRVPAEMLGFRIGNIVRDNVPKYEQDRATKQKEQ